MIQTTTMSAAFAIVTTIALTIGIAANAIMFGVVDQLGALLELGELLAGQVLGHDVLHFCAKSSRASFSLRAPMVIRTPSAPYGRTTMRASAACSTNASTLVENES